ncbi:MAG: chloride channel protein, partial [Acidobacteriota bacterium]
AYAFFGFFTGWEPLFAIPSGLKFDEPGVLAGFALLGLMAGLIGAVLPKLLYGVRDLARRIPGPPHVRPAIGGLLVGLVALAVPEIIGTGYGWIELAMAGQLSLVTLLLLVLLKGPGMAATIGTGGSGGVFAPTVTLGGLLGATIGMTLARVLPIDVSVASFTVVGMAAVFAGAARAPISTLIMVVEMTGGYGLIVPAMLANVLAFMVQRGLTYGRTYPTLYESQVPEREDSPLHQGVLVRRAMEVIDTGNVEPEQIRLPRLVNLLRYGRPIPVSAGSGEVLAAIEIESGSALDDTNVADAIGIVEGATAVAIISQREIVVPRGATPLVAGETIVLLATPEAYETLRRRAREGDEAD